MVRKNLTVNHSVVIIEMPNTDIALYFPEDMIYDLKLRVLNEERNTGERIRLDVFIAQKLRDALKDPSKLKDIKSPRYARRMTTDVPRDVWREIKKLSDKRNVTMNAIVYTILSNALAKQEKTK